MVTLKPELEKRGYEVVVFHTTGMGGRALEAIAAQSGFAAVMDFSLQELANHLNGSVVTFGRRPAGKCRAARAFRRSSRRAPSTWSIFRPGSRCRRASPTGPTTPTTGCSPR